MTVYYLQHVPFEGLGAIADWTRTHGIPVARVALFEDQPLPAARETDALIVMGGPMGANDENRYAWIAAEKRFIAQVIEQGKTVLGICLGAQMIAAVLGLPQHPQGNRLVRSDQDKCRRSHRFGRAFTRTVHRLPLAWGYL